MLLTPPIATGMDSLKIYHLHYLPVARTTSSGMCCPLLMTSRIFDRLASLPRTSAAWRHAWSCFRNGGESIFMFSGRNFFSNSISNNFKGSRENHHKRSIRKQEMEITCVKQRTLLPHQLTAVFKSLINISFASFSSDATVFFQVSNKVVAADCVTAKIHSFVHRTYIAPLRDNLLRGVICLRVVTETWFHDSTRFRSLDQTYWRGIKRCCTLLWTIISWFNAANVECSHLANNNNVPI